MKINTFLNRLLFAVIVFVSFQTFSQNLLVNGGFESGGAGVGFNTDYTLPAAAGTSAPRNYNILNDPFTMNTANFAHAGDYPTGSGRMMVVDGSGSAADRVWVLANGGSIGVISGRTYEFTYYIRSISGTNNVGNAAIIDVQTNGTSTIPQLMSGPSIVPLGNPSAWTRVAYRWTATTTNAQIILVDTQTFGGGAGNDFAIDNLSLVDINAICSTPVISVTQQPTCPIPTGTAVFTSPLNAAPTPRPTDLFISEVTDESTGSLSYIEIYNGTGVTKNLTNYKIKVYNNGNPGPSLNCDIPLIGNLANNDVFVISFGSVANQGGVIPDMVSNLCPGFNNDDNVRLSTIADVDIDLWGRTDGVVFTPANQPGYTYRRLATAPKPSMTWNPAEWTAIDPQDYTDVGNYLFSIYEYSLNATTYQSSPTFTGLPPNTTYNNVTIRDIISGCVSIPVSITVDPIAPSAPPSVLPITYCPNATAVPLTAIPATGGTLNWYGQNITGGTPSATGPIPSTTGAPGSTLTYYVSQTVNGCESSRAALTVYIGRVPAAGQNPFVFCDTANTTDAVVAFDFNNIVWQFNTPPTPNLQQTSWGYSYSINGGPLVTGTHTGVSNFNVPVTTPGSQVVFTVTWNGICTPPLTATCNADCLVTPVLAITNPAAVCSPNTVDLTAAAVTAGSTNVGTFTYWTNNLATIPLANPNAVTTSGTYFIKSALGNCFDINPVVVVVNPSPVLTITNPAAVCSGTTVNLQAAAVTAGSTGGGTLTYWTDAAATLPLASPGAVATGGTYYIKSTVGSCTDIEPVTVVINPSPVLSINSPAAVCSPASVNLQAPAVTAGSTGGGTLSYWTNAAATIPLASPGAVTTAGTYYIKSTLGTCFDIEAVTVTITTTPVLTITNPAAVCSPATVSIQAAAVTAGSTGGGTLSYWFDAATTIGISNPATIAAGGTYYIKSTVGTCTDIKPVVVVINPSPVLTITNPAAVCSPATVNLQDPAVTAGSTGGGTLSYWTNAAATTPLASPGAVSTSGTYYIKSTAGTCTDIEPVTVVVTTTPVLSITNPASVCSPATVNLQAPAVTAGSTGGGTLSYWFDALATIGISNPGTIAAGGTYYIKSTVGTCSDIEPVVVTIVSTPVLSITNPATVCSPSTVDLTTAAVTSGSTGGGILSYWTNATATTALASPGAVTTSGTYYIKSTVGACFDIEAVTVVISPSPVLSINNPAAVCSPTTINLQDPAVTAGSTNAGTLSYWTDAAATIALSNPGAVNTGGTYYIKSTLGSCTDIEPVLVTINPTPVLSITNPAAVCSPNTVDLTAAAVTAGSTGGGVLSYWTNAIATTALASPGAVTASGTYYIKSTLGSCSDIEQVVVIINNPNLVITNPAAVCSPATVNIQAPAVTAGSTGGGILSYWTDALATIPLANPGAVAMGGTYYIKSTVGTCFDIKPVVVSINSNFVVNNPQPLRQCDPSNDGYLTFNLTQVINSVTGGNPAFTVSFHETTADANLPGTSIPNPSAYDNILRWAQTVYIRVSSTGSSCYQVVPLQLIVNPIPVATEPADYELCDMTGLPHYESFNLPTRVSEILGTINPTTVTVYFYDNQPDAQTNNTANAIINVGNYTNATPDFQTLYVVVMFNATGCFDVVDLNLVVNPLPRMIQPNYPQYSKCDDDRTRIGYEVFDLGSRVNTILGGQNGMQVSFHYSYGDAQNNTRIISLLYENEIQFVQTIGIRMTNTTTGCYSVSSMDIRVEPLPTLIPQPAYVLCDENQDGFTCGFDLAAMIPDLLGGGNYTLSFYATRTDAQNGTVINVIDHTQLYCNINPYMQLLYVRAVDNLTGCVSVTTIELNVNRSPIAPLLLTDIVVCDYDSDTQNGQTTVDLTQRTADVLALQPPPSSDYIVTYYDNPFDATSTSGANELVPASAHIGSDNDTIWVRVEHVTTHCFSVGTFQIKINAPLLLIRPTPLSLCDDDTNPRDQLHSFDLTVKNAEITQNLPGHTVTYYPSLAAATAGVPGTEIQNPTAYVNGPVRTLGVVVTTPAPASCQSITTLDIRVLPIPSPLTTNIPPLAAKCDDNSPGDMMEIFDLTVNESYIANGDPNLTFHYFRTRANAEDNVNEILPDPTQALVGGPFVYIRVENTMVDYQGNHCYVIVQQGLTVNPLPTVQTSIAPFRACDDNADGITVFNLAAPELAPRILGPSQAVTDYTISYYLTAAGANPLTNTGETPLPMSYSSANATIYIRVTNNTTACVNATGTLDLVVEDYAVANPVTPYHECDRGLDGNPYDGVEILDLDALFTAEVLGTQNPAVFLVSYYTSDPTIIPAPRALTLAEAQAYQTDQDNDVIWIKVENSSNSIVPFCNAITQAIITIERRPNPVINTDSGARTICVDYITGAVIRDLTLNSGITNPANYTFEWYETSDMTTVLGTGPTYTVDTASTGGAPREYVVQVTNNFGGTTLNCDTESPRFTVLQSGPAVVPAGTPAYTISNAFGDPQSVTVNVVGFGDYWYSLDDGPRQQSNVFNNVSFEPHTIHVWDMTDGVANSCDELIIQFAQTIDYPHYFTPNGDGINDTWFIRGLSGQPGARIYIFDRYGKLLKQISAAGSGWDGTYNGHMLPADDYWFSVDFAEPNTGQQMQFKAHFTLKR